MSKSVAIESYFNSIKVQLERYQFSFLQIHPKFQFHKGTIRTDKKIYDRELSALFQFHKGTIRTEGCDCQSSA